MLKSERYASASLAGSKSKRSQMSLVEGCLVILTTLGFLGLFHFGRHRRQSHQSNLIIMQKLKDIHEVLERLKGK